MYKGVAMWSPLLCLRQAQGESIHPHHVCVRFESQDISSYLLGPQPRLMKRILTLLLVAFCFSAVAQCEADHVVEVSSFIYAPNTLTIGQGESVAWINLGGTHDVNGRQ